MVWALGRLKGKAAPGKDGWMAEMINSVNLVDFWYELFKLCWKEGVVLSNWKQGDLMPVQMRSKSPFVTDDLYSYQFV